MNPSTQPNRGSALNVAEHYVVALYEATTGMIRHLHMVTVFEGGQQIEEIEAIRQAHEKAVEAGHRIDDLKHKISKNAEHGCRPHRIDVDSDEFVAVEPQFHDLRKRAGRSGDAATAY